MQNSLKPASRTHQRIARLMDDFLRDQGLVDARLDSLRFDQAFGIWLGWLKSATRGNSLLLSYRLKGQWVVVPYGVWPQVAEA